MGENALNAKSVEALLFVHMGNDALNAKSAELLFAVDCRVHTAAAVCIPFVSDLNKLGIDQIVIQLYQ